MNPKAARRLPRLAVIRAPAERYSRRMVNGGFQMHGTIIAGGAIVYIS